MVKSALDSQIAEIAEKTDKKILVMWACDCAERALPCFERNYPTDARPRLAIEAGRAWVRTGVFHMSDIRAASLAAHAVARTVSDDDAARSAARAAGQAVATAHAAGHAVAAAIYAATAVRDEVGPTGADGAVAKEREWQYEQLLKLRSNHDH